MGRSAKDRFTQGGIEGVKEISASRKMMFPVSALWQAPPDHPLHDPRSLYAPDQAMAEDMADRIRRGEMALMFPILAREEPQAGGKIRLHVCNGSQRTNAARVAERILFERGDLSKGSGLNIEVELFTGDDAEFLEARILANAADPWRKADLPSILAVRCLQLTAFGREPSAIAKVCGDGIGPAEVEALLRWGNLGDEGKARFDAGAPIGLLAAVLSAPRDEQIATLDRLIAKGIRSTRTATRAINKERGAIPKPTLRRVAREVERYRPREPNEEEIEGVMALDPQRIFFEGMRTGLDMARKELGLAAWSDGEAVGDVSEVEA